MKKNNKPGKPAQGADAPSVEKIDDAKDELVHLYKQFFRVDIFQKSFIELSRINPALAKLGSISKRREFFEIVKQCETQDQLQKAYKELYSSKFFCSLSGSDFDFCVAHLDLKKDLIRIKSL